MSGQYLLISYQDQALLIIIGTADYLTGLSTELLQEIFLLSKNLSLSCTCRQLRSVLGNEGIRARFYANAIVEAEVCGPSNCTNPSLTAEHCGEAVAMRRRDEALSQTWFDLDLSAEVAALVHRHPSRAHIQHIRALDGTAGCRILGPCGGKRAARLPRRLLLGPWTNNDVKLLRLFFDWSARVDAYSDINTYYTGLWDAIWDNKSELVELLLRLRPPSV